MAQVVLIKNKTPLADIGDFITTYQNGTIDPLGSGYIGFTVLQVRLSVPNFMQIVRAALTETRWYKLSNKIEAETSPGIFEEISRMPKYRVNFSNLTEQDIIQLAGVDTSPSVCISILTDKVRSCVMTQIDNLRV